MTPESIKTSLRKCDGAEPNTPGAIWNALVAWHLNSKIFSTAFFNTDPGTNRLSLHPKKIYTRRPDAILDISKLG
ncbi:hypothetical protein J6590_035232 [Homalodisca vitripennis]|nr:hypothetical protein J6590_035232 [Homalodisca vitripennis]